MKPFVSVIMPVFNQEKFLVETIESVLSQSYDDFEFLILDDGSTDGSSKIIRKFLKIDKRIDAFFEPNKGKCLATNELAIKATGEFCVFMDADDIMMPNRLEKQVQFHQSNPNIVASSSHCYYIDETGSILGQQRYPFLRNEEECKKAFLSNEIIHCAFTGLMVRREIFLKIGGLDPKFWPCEDLDLANKIIEKGYLLVIIQENLMKYRIHTSSVTAQKQWHMFDMGAYTSYCILQRRSGKEVCTFDEFKSQQQKAGWRYKFHENRSRYSKILHKNAGLEFYRRKYWNFFWNFLMAFILKPGYVIDTIKNRYNFKYNWNSNNSNLNS